MEFHKVTVAEYNQALRDAVNAYYEHALNDPSMTREEAISSTMEMSERYLNAVEEFQAELQVQEAAEQAASLESMESAAVETGMEGGTEGGMSGGTEGGMSGGIGGE